MKKLLSLLLATSALQFSAGFAQAASIEVVDDLPGSSINSQATDVSANGLAVVGQSNGANGQEAYIWTLAGGIVGLGDLAGSGFFSHAFDVSADGSVVVGYSTSANGVEAFRWTQGTGMEGLGDLMGGGFSSLARGVSGNGLVIVGQGESANGTEAFRWMQGTGIEGLGDLMGGGFFSLAFAANTDGSVIVGQGESAGGAEAFRWTQGGGMVGLGDLTGGNFSSSAKDVSADGLVVVGYSESANGGEAFRWTQGSNMVGLGDLAGGSFFSEATAVNADGSVVVGYGNSASGTEAFRWTQGTGMLSLKDVLLAENVDMTGWNLLNAQGVSADGNIITGDGNYNGDSLAYLANIATGGLTTPDALGASLNTVAQASQQAGAQAMQYVPQGLFAAQNISAISTPISGGYAFRNPEDVTPAAGDYETLLSAFMLGSYGIGANDDFKNDQWNGTIGMTAEIAEGFNVGAGVIAGTSRQELDFEGDSDLDALGGLALLSFEPDENGFRMYATAYATDLKLEIKRGYTNGAGLDSSLGKTDGVSYGTAVKLGWEEDVFYGLTAMPYIEGRYAKTKIDSYEEQGGAFAANFSKQDNNYAASRLGVEFDYTATENLELMLRPAWGRRLTGDNASFTADVSGLTQSLSSDAGDRNWAELTLGAKYQATEDVKFTTELTGRSGDTAEPAAALMIGSSIKF